MSGLIAGLMAVPNVGSFNQDNAAISLEIYSSNFESLAILSIVVALALFFINPLIKKFMRT